VETVPTVSIRHTFIHKKTRYHEFHGAMTGRPVRLPLDPPLIGKLRAVDLHVRRTASAQQPNPGTSKSRIRRGKPTGDPGRPRKMTAGAALQAVRRNQKQSAVVSSNDIRLQMLGVAAASHQLAHLRL